KRHLDKLRIHSRASPHLLQAVDDHSFAQLQTFGNFTETVVKRSQMDGARNDLICFVQDVDDFLVLVGVESTLTHEHGLMWPADGRADTGKQPGEQNLLLVGKHSPHSYGAGLPVDLIVTEVDGAPMRLALLVGQSERHGKPAVAG